MQTFRQDSVVLLLYRDNATNRLTKGETVNFEEILIDERNVKLIRRDRLMLPLASPEFRFLKYAELAFYDGKLMLISSLKRIPSISFPLRSSLGSLTLLSAQLIWAKEKFGLGYDEPNLEYFFSP